MSIICEDCGTDRQATGECVCSVYRLEFKNVCFETSASGFRYFFGKQQDILKMLQDKNSSHHHGCLTRSAFLQGLHGWSALSKLFSFIDGHVYKLRSRITSMCCCQNQVYGGQPCFLLTSCMLISSEKKNPELSRTGCKTLVTSCFVSEHSLFWLLLFSCKWLTQVDLLQLDFRGPFISVLFLHLKEGDLPDKLNPFFYSIFSTCL